MNELGIFRREFRNSQDVSDEIQMSISFIKDELQTFRKTQNTKWNKQNAIHMIPNNQIVEGLRGLACKVSSMTSVALSPEPN